MRSPSSSIGTPTMFAPAWGNAPTRGRSRAARRRRIAGADGGTGEQREGHIAAARDHDVLCSGGDPARVREHRRERLAKLYGLGILRTTAATTARADRVAICAPDQVSGREPHVHARGSEEPVPAGTSCGSSGFGAGSRSNPARADSTAGERCGANRRGRAPEDRSRRTCRARDAMEPPSATGSANAATTVRRCTPTARARCACRQGIAGTEPAAPDVESIARAICVTSGTPARRSSGRRFPTAMRSLEEGRSGLKFSATPAEYRGPVCQQCGLSRSWLIDGVSHASRHEGCTSSSMMVSSLSIDLRMSRRATCRTPCKLKSEASPWQRPNRRQRRERTSRRQQPQRNAKRLFPSCRKNAHGARQAGRKDGEAEAPLAELAQGGSCRAGLLEILLNESRAHVHVELHERLVSNRLEAVHLARLDDEYVTGTCLELIAVHRVAAATLANELDLVVGMTMRSGPRPGAPLNRNTEMPTSP